MESKAEYHLDITPADVWADYAKALDMDDLEPYDPSWKSCNELAEIAAQGGVMISPKTVETQAKRAVAAGTMERQWQMRETTGGPRRMAVYRVVKHDSK